MGRRVLYSSSEKHAGYRRKSTITETEDVSYVSSAYVPQCLRYGGRPTLSNAHRAHESGVNTDNIRDELDEVITLNSVSIIVAEYIPFGANQARMVVVYRVYPGAAPVTPALMRILLHRLEIRSTFTAVT